MRVSVVPRASKAIGVGRVTARVDTHVFVAGGPTTAHAAQDSRDELVIVCKPASGGVLVIPLAVIAVCVLGEAIDVRTLWILVVKLQLFDDVGLGRLGLFFYKLFLTLIRSWLFDNLSFSL